MDLSELPPPAPPPVKPRQPWGLYAAGCGFALVVSILFVILVLRALGDAVVGGY